MDLWKMVCCLLFGECHGRRDISDRQAFVNNKSIQVSRGFRTTKMDSICEPISQEGWAVVVQHVWKKASHCDL